MEDEDSRTGYKKADEEESSSQSSSEEQPKKKSRVGTEKTSTEKTVKKTVEKTVEKKITLIKEAKDIVRGVLQFMNVDDDDFDTVVDTVLNDRDKQFFNHIANHERFIRLKHHAFEFGLNFFKKGAIPGWVNEHICKPMGYTVHTRFIMLERLCKKANVPFIPPEKKNDKTPQKTLGKKGNEIEKDSEQDDDEDDDQNDSEDDDSEQASEQASEQDVEEVQNYRTFKIKEIRTEKEGLLEMPITFIKEPLVEQKLNAIWKKLLPSTQTYMAEKMAPIYAKANPEGTSKKFDDIKKDLLALAEEDPNVSVFVPFLIAAEEFFIGLDLVRAEKGLFQIARPFRNMICGDRASLIPFDDFAGIRNEWMRENTEDGKAISKAEKKKDVNKFLRGTARNIIGYLDDAKKSGVDERGVYSMIATMFDMLNNNGTQEEKGILRAFDVSISAFFELMVSTQKMQEEAEQEEQEEAEQEEKKKKKKEWGWFVVVVVGWFLISFLRVVYIV